MRKASIKLAYGIALAKFTLTDQIVSEIDSIYASPREKRADLLMNYRGKLYDRRAIYQVQMINYKKVLNIED